ncbi:MAG: RNA polymerase sigma factor [Thermoanaerobaculia bacterium]
MAVGAVFPYSGVIEGLEPETRQETGNDRLHSDRLTARQIVSGDEAAFERLVEAHHAKLSRIAGRFFRRPEVVEDVVQDVFVKAFLRMGDYRGEMPLEHWLSKITVNGCYDQLRKQQSRSETDVSQLAADLPDFFERMAAPEGSPAAGFWQREEARICAESMLARLSPEERLVLTLTVLDDRSVAEVALLTGWSKTNVKVRAFRARRRLKGFAAAGRKER